MNYSNIRLAVLCEWFGVTRQAYYQSNRNAVNTNIEELLVLQEVFKIRASHKQMGTRKLYAKLQPFLSEHRIKMGRDALFDLLSANKMLVRKRKRRVITTQSYHWLKKYPNLIKEFIPTGPNQLWVSDITHWKLKDNLAYISFITDAYSHKIVGYHIAKTLASIETIKALKMALSNLRFASHFQLIHHSDRGAQYCEKQYVKLLQDNNIQISMSKKGTPLENAIAERLNGIIKEEYLNNYQLSNLDEAKHLLKHVVKLYNEERPHNSIGNFYPNEVHENNLKTEKLWKSYYKKNSTFVN